MCDKLFAGEHLLNIKEGFGSKAVLRAVIRGTVASGHPLNTTAGNTVRVLSYIKYIAHKANVYVEPLVAGDDALVFIERKDLDAFYEVFGTVYDVPTKEFPMGEPRPHGLGLLAKEF